MLWEDFLSDICLNIILYASRGECVILVRTCSGRWSDICVRICDVLLQTHGEFLISYSFRDMSLISGYRIWDRFLFLYCKTVFCVRIHFDVLRQSRASRSSPAYRPAFSVPIYE